MNFLSRPTCTVLRLDSIDDITWSAQLHFSDGSSSRAVQIPKTMFKNVAHGVFGDNLVEDDVHTDGKRVAMSWVVHDVPYVLRALDINLNQEE